MDKTSGGTVTSTKTYYPAGGAMRVDGTRYYVLKDHLGSGSVVTNQSATTVGEDRFYPFGETRFTTGNMKTDKLFTGQHEMAGLGIYHYGARFYSPYLNQFTQPDTIVPNLYNPQSLNRYSYVQNNPIRYNDPSGHKICNNVGMDGTCKDTKEERKLDQLLNFVEKEITSKKGKKKPKSREAMEMVVKKAAYIYGKDWNGFLDATTFVFTGYYGHGAGTMWNAHHSGEKGLIDGGSGFHSDFTDKDGSQQVRHFWAGFATAANPTGGNPYGVAVALKGNDYHEIESDTPEGLDGATMMDWQLTMTAIDIASQTGDKIQNPSDLAQVLHDQLSPDGPGAAFPAQLWQWFTPYD